MKTAVILNKLYEAINSADSSANFDISLASVSDSISEDYKVTANGKFVCLLCFFPDGSLTFASRHSINKPLSAWRISYLADLVLVLYENQF